MSPSIKSLARGALLRAVHRIAPTEAETALRFLEARGFAAFPQRNVTVVSQVPRGRVLILSPHPDDEAIGLGGALCMHVANGSAVTVQPSAAAARCAASWACAYMAARTAASMWRMSIVARVSPATAVTTPGLHTT